jgi:predicted AlkP superfamily phosphohydrolase/phosphomutase
MLRRARIAPGDLVYHILNRANGRNELFSKPEDYLNKSWSRRRTASHSTAGVRLMAGGHVVLWPREDVRWQRLFEGSPPLFLTVAP